MVNMSYKHSCIQQVSFFTLTYNAQEKCLLPAKSNLPKCSNTWVNHFPYKGDLAYELITRVELTMQEMQYLEF